MRAFISARRRGLGMSSAFGDYFAIGPAGLTFSGQADPP